MSRTELSQGAWIDLDPGWLPSPDAARLLSALTAELSWEQRHIVLFGKPILQPRLIAWAGELPYRYSGQTLEPRRWPAALVAELGALSDRISDAAGSAFNHVLVDRYRDGKDSMGYHADAEPELGPDPIVATLSLGATRRFLIRPHPTRQSERPRSLPLGAGSLLVMGGTCQRHYRHAIARENTAQVGERISLTFRLLMRAPEPGR